MIQNHLKHKSQLMLEGAERIDFSFFPDIVVHLFEQIISKLRHHCTFDCLYNGHGIFIFKSCHSNQ